MGLFNAIGMTETETTLEQQISWHLQANHYPPIPTVMVPVCIQAIDALKDGDAEREIPMPFDGVDSNGEPFQVTWRGQITAPAWAIAEHAHLDAWLMISDGDLYWDEGDDE
jgi:hypothetical protein